MDKQFMYRGHSVVIRDPVMGVRPGEVAALGITPVITPAGHDMPPSDAGGGAMEGGHADMSMTEVIIDDHLFQIHRFTDGKFLTHELPFVTHDSAQAAARAIIDMASIVPLAPVMEPTTVPVSVAPRDVDYTLRGDFFEFCDCYTLCPCWVDGAPDDAMCTGVFAWVVNEGTIDGVDVAGHITVSVSTHEGHRDSAHQRVMIFVDERTSDAQAAALAGAFSGRFGGPLRELSSLLGTLLGVERAKIDVHWGSCGSQLTVGRRIAVDAVNSIGSTGKVTTLADGRLSTVLGSPAEVGVARSLRVGLKEHGIDLDVRGRSAMRGHFNYRNDLSQ